jgi:hypothetical protein
MDIKLVDVTIHVDENLDEAQRKTVDEQLRAVDGVVSVHNPDKTPHLMTIEYNPEKVDSASLLATVKATGVHAEMIGL